MARLFTAGAEMGDNLEWSAFTGANPSSAAARSGNFGFWLNGYNDWARFSLSTPVSESFYRIPFRPQMALQPVGAASSSTRIASFKSGSTELARVVIDGVNAKLAAFVGSTNIGTGIKDVSVSTFYLVEVRYKVSSTVGVLQVKINSAMDIDFSGNTQPGSDTTYNVVETSEGTSEDVVAWIYLDDVALNDTTGTEDFSWCGDGRILPLIPNAAGTYTSIATVVGAATHWEAVDEVPHDVDTTYILDEVIDRKDTFNTSHTVPSTVTINRVWVEARARCSVSGTASLAALVLSGASLATGPDTALLSTYGRVASSFYTTDPNTGLAWTFSAVDALEVGVKIR